jgi:hypothetical protein
MQIARTPKASNFSNNKVQIKNIKDTGMSNFIPFYFVCSSVDDVFSAKTLHNATCKITVNYDNYNMINKAVVDYLKILKQISVRRHKKSYEKISVKTTGINNTKHNMVTIL